MDVDPLADTIPPRHAIESDEEEDEYNPIRTKAVSVELNQIADVRVIGDLPKSHPLLIATGDVGKFWAKGADLGEQRGAIAVNGIQVGLAFRPAWTKAIVIISEALTRLPLWAMFHYALTTLDTLKPVCVVLLDTYPVTTYNTSTPISFQDAPLRYLSTSPIAPDLKSKVFKYSPPNLILSTSAAFLSIVSTFVIVPGTVILAPSPYISHPPPKVLSPSNFSHLSEDKFEWSHDAMNTVQELLFNIIAEPVTPKWENTGEKDIPTTRRKKIVGEESMYI